MENNVNQPPTSGQGGQSNFSSFNNSNNPLPQRPPNNYLALSIIAIILCLPFGIAGILNATKVESLFAAGDIEGAETASNNAKKYSKIGIITAAALWVVYIIIIVISVVLGASSSAY